MLGISDSASDFSSDSTDSDDAKKKHPKDLKSIQETNRLVFWLCCVHICGILQSIKGLLIDIRLNYCLYGCHVHLSFCCKT